MRGDPPLIGYALSANLELSAIADVAASDDMTLIAQFPMGMPTCGSGKPIKATAATAIAQRASI